MSEAKIKVKRIKVEGKSYLYDERTNIVYDEKSKEAVGVLSEDKKSIDFYDDDEDEEDEEEEEEIEIAFKANVGGEKVSFYEPIDNSVIDLPKNHYISLDNYEYGGHRIKYVVTKKDKKVSPEGIVVYDDNDDLNFISIDDDEPSRFLTEVGRKGYNKLMELGFAPELEEIEKPDAKREAGLKRIEAERQEKVEAKREEKLNKLEQQIKDLLGVMRELQNQSKMNKDVNVKKDLAKRFKETKEQVDKLGELYRKEKELIGKGIEPKDTKLYEKAKQIADEKYKKPSAYKSGFIVKKYKELGGTYSGKKPQKTGIARWFKEEWKDVGNAEYPVYRPTKRITIETPLTPDEIKPSNLKKQIKLKQEIRGDANLPPFLPFGKVEPKKAELNGAGVYAIGVQAEKIPKQDEVWKWSNPDKVAEMAKKYLGDMAVVFRSTKPKKKYMIFDPNNNKWVFFGEMGYEDFTKHQDEKRRENYLTRTAKMKGNWKDNKYSANNLSRNILW